MSDHVDVSVVLVVRDEPPERIERVLEALRRQVTGATLVVELIAAGPSEQVASIASTAPGGSLAEVRTVDNPTGARSAGLNLAARAARGDVIVRVDARTIPPVDYIERCVGRLRTAPRVGVVGGVQWPEVTGESRAARAAARALRNRWLIGNPAYRRPGAGGAVDTVYLGAFRRAELLERDGWDEGLEANEDFDLCARYRAAGFDVWLEPDLVVGYEPRSSVGALFRQYEAFGAAKVHFWRRTGNRPNGRQRLALGAAGMAALVTTWSARRPTRAFALVVAALLAVGLVDHVADPDEGDLGVRVGACVNALAITGGWTAGIARALLGGRDRLR